ncbi:MAG: aminotransferase class V-fold PLP-dependent enzyme [Chthoniobacteraceae bacterium]
MLYFDHNATHPISETAKRAWLDAVEKFPANPSSPHRPGQRAEAALQDARERLAGILCCSADGIVFTSGATESANMVLAQFDDVVASAIEHPCVLEPLRFSAGKNVEASRGKKSARGTPSRSVRFLLSAVTGVVEPLRLAGKVPQLVALMAANNETGVLQPWREALAVCRANGMPMFCDAAQWIGRLAAAGLGECDFVSGCAHKFGGPQGVGFLKCPANFPPLLRGGPQEEGRRAGTENVAGVLAMLAALEEREAAIRDGALRGRLEWRAEFESELTASLPGVRVLGAEAERLWNTVSVIMPETPDCRRRWVVVMDRLGFAVSTGSACASGKEKPSHVLTAMGVKPGDAARALRFSAGWGTTRDDWRALLDGVKAAAREMEVR